MGTLYWNDKSSTSGPESVLPHNCVLKRLRMTSLHVRSMTVSHKYWV